MSTSKYEFERFFRNFPKSAIIVNNQDIGGGKTKKMICERKRWQDWSFYELQKLNKYDRMSIFFTTCDIKEDEKGIGHRNTNFDGIRTYHCEVDLLSREEWATTSLSDEEKKQLLADREAELSTKLVFNDTHGLLPPSLVVSSRNGFHIYWLAWHEEKMDEEYAPVGGLYRPPLNSYAHIQEGLAKTLGGDTNAIKKVQLLRVPGFLNHKPGGPYPVRLEGSLCNYIDEETKEEPLKFCEDQFLKIYGPVPEEEKNYKPRGKIYISKKKIDCIFEKLKEMPQDQALMMVSGTKLVNGERYKIVPQAGGLKGNIHIVNGDGSLSGGACHINFAKNCIFVPRGSGKGSPNILEWIKWYNPAYTSNPADFAAALKEVFTNI